MVIDLEQTNCYFCTANLITIHKKMPDYLGKRQYGCSAKICTNIKNCQLAVDLKKVDSWTTYRTVPEFISKD